jgi:hypothetical protein
MVLSALILCLPVFLAAPQDPAKAAEFSQRLMEAAEVSDTKAMSLAMQKYSEDAILLFLNKADVRSMSDEEEINVWVDAFVAAWDKTYHSDFARNYDRYLQRLSDSNRQVRYNLLQKNYPDINRKHIAAMKNEETAWGVLRTNAEGTAVAIERIGDLFYAARTWNIVGNLYNPDFHEEGSDATKACEAYAKCIDARDRLGLKTDRFYGEVTKTLSGLRASAGVADPNAPEGAVVKPKVSREKIPVLEGAVASEGKFETAYEKKPGGIEHASDLSDEDHFNWLRGSVPKPGEQIRVGGFNPQVNLIRIGAAKYKLEAGADESKEFRLTEKPKKYSVDRMHSDGVVRPFMLELCTGTASDVYQGITMNLAPSDEGGPLFFRSLATITTSTAFGQFTIYDTSADGKYGVEELALVGAEGLMENSFLYRTDAMTLGKMKHSLPFSRFFPDAKGNWYEVNMPGYEMPYSVTLTPVQPKLGPLIVDYQGIKKLKLNSLLIASKSSATKGMVLDLATMKGKQLMVPIGRYQVMQARFTGKDGHEMMVLMDADKPYLIDVVAETTEPPVIELGAPFKLHASVEISGGTVTVGGKTLFVLGRHDERYVRMIGAPLFGVEVSAKGSKSSELSLPSAEEAAADWSRLFYPMDTSIEVKSGRKPVITLSIKKHPWFGKLSNVIGK